MNDEEIHDDQPQSGLPNPGPLPALGSSLAGIRSLPLCRLPSSLPSAQQCSLRLSWMCRPNAGRCSFPA